jgi:alkylation response protein AidB-like acyl-CoA dehydrogenase
MSVVDLPHRASPSPAEPPAYEALASRFRPIFARVAEGAVEREQTRSLPFEEIAALRDAGFGAIRLPIAQGGSGATLPQLFRLLVELGEADSNLVQILRAHFAFVEGRLNSDDIETNDRWLPRVANNQLIGAAMAERTAATETTLELRREGDHFRLDGEKYYCTGTLYADWVQAAAKEDEDRISVLVPTDAPGVSLFDDWDGFGQRLTGSGTTRFENVAVEEWQILRRFNPGEIRADSYITAFFQQFHLAAFAGIARAAKRDAIAFVQAKTRQFGKPGLSEPAQDPLVQRVVGRIASQVFVAESIVERVSEALQTAHEAWLSGEGLEEALIEADRRAYQGQQVLVELVPQIASLIFEVGGASATQEARRLDRHWRNARVLGSHNPAIARERLIGDHYLNGVSFRDEWLKLWGKPEEKDDAASDAAPALPREALASVG